MYNERRDELLERLARPKKKIAVAIVDDLAKKFREQIKSEIDVIVFDFPIEFAKNKGFKEYDVVFFDATYEQDGVSTIDILEKLIQKEPELEEKSIVLIGEDVIDWGRHNDSEIKELVSRVKSLPNIVYGNERGSKIELMIKHIERVGRKNNIEVPKTAPQGICREEVLEAIKPYLEQIDKNVTEQTTLSINIRETLKKIEPTNENERKIIEHMQGIAELFKHNAHILKQEYYHLGHFYNKGKESRNAVAEEGKKEGQGQNR